MSDKYPTAGLKPCPFCGQYVHPDYVAPCYVIHQTYKIWWSHGCIFMTPSDWNARPIEDALNARIAELEAEGRGLGQVSRLVSAATSKQLEHPLRSGQEMKKAIELYGGYEGSYYDDYQPMVEEFGNVILQEADNGYQGSTWVLYQDGIRFGYLRFGWGSCSGCDALKACDSIEEVQELMDELWQSIMWFDTRTDALKFFIEHDWDGDWDANTEAARLFVEKAVKLLGPADAGDDVLFRHGWERR